MTTANLDARKHGIVAELGMPAYRVLCGEAGRPAEQLDRAAFDRLVLTMQRERRANWYHLVNLKNAPKGAGGRP